MSGPNWDAKYASAPDGLFGADANDYVRSVCERPSFAARNALFLADGDGRNSRWFAARGGAATSVDLSGVAVENALQLDRQAGVHVDRYVGDVSEWCLPGDTTWDAAFLIYLQAPWPVRRAALQLAWRALGSQGLLVIEGFAKTDTAAGCGPPNSDLRYSVDEIRALLPDARVLELASHEIHLDEGPRHRGRAVVLRACLARN